MVCLLGREPLGRARAQRAQQPEGGGLLSRRQRAHGAPHRGGMRRKDARDQLSPGGGERQDRKSTRLNSSHVSISYAVFCLKKKKKPQSKMKSPQPNNKTFLRKQVLSLLRSTHPSTSKRSISPPKPRTHPLNTTNNHNKITP